MPLLPDRVFRQSFLNFSTVCHRELAKPSGPSRFCLLVLPLTYLTPAFYDKQQEETSRHLQQFTWKSPQLHARFIWHTIHLPRNADDNSLSSLPLCNNYPSLQFPIIVLISCRTCTGSLLQVHVSTNNLLRESRLFLICSSKIFPAFAQQLVPKPLLHLQALVTAAPPPFPVSKLCISCPLLRNKSPTT